MIKSEVLPTFAFNDNWRLGEANASFYKEPYQKMQNCSYSYKISI